MLPGRAVLLPWEHHLACKQQTIQDSVEMEHGTQVIKTPQAIDRSLLKDFLGLQ